MKGASKTWGSSRLRVLLAVLGLDQHEGGLLAVATILRDHGVEVVYAGRFQLPETLAAVAEEEDVDVIGVSCHSWEFLHHAADLARRAHALEPPIPVVVGGSVLTAADREEAIAKGLDEVVLPTASVSEIVEAFTRLAAQGGAVGESLA